MPNSTHEKSTHTCYLRIPGLPKELRKEHIALGLSHSSLVSIKRLCKGGYEVVFKENDCEVWYQNRKVLTGRTIGPGGLWILPIDTRESLEDETMTTMQNPLSLSNTTVHTLLYKQQKVKYMHQTFSPCQHPCWKSSNQQAIVGISVHDY